MTIRWPMICGLTLVLAFVAAGAHGALDRDTVTRWIAAAQDLQGWADKFEEEDPDHEYFDSDKTPTYADIENVYREMYNRDAEARSTIRRHGFRSADQWADVSARITMGMISLEMGEQQPQMDAEMQAALRELESNPDVSPQMREMMLQQMQLAMGIMSGLTEGVREEDLPLLREMRSELRAVMEFGDMDDDYGDDEEGW
jgi:hypothetical protein